jgi:hypothetical protein
LPWRGGSLFPLLGEASAEQKALYFPVVHLVQLRVWSQLRSVGQFGLLAATRSSGDRGGVQSAHASDAPGFTVSVPPNSFFHSLSVSLAMIQPSACSSRRRYRGQAPCHWRWDPPRGGRKSGVPDRFSGGEVYRAPTAGGTCCRSVHSLPLEILRISGWHRGSW